MVGPAAPRINALLVNWKGAADALWKERGYDSMRPHEIKERLGYALDCEDATGYVVTSALHMPLLSPDEAKAIGKRVVSAITPSGSLGTQLKKLRKRGASVEPLLQAQASLNLSPPPRKSVAAPKPPLPPPAEPPPPAPQQQRTTTQRLSRGWLTWDPTEEEMEEVEAQLETARLLVAKATGATWHLEQALGDLEIENPEHRSFEDEECEAKALLYKLALRRLRDRLPPKLAEYCPEELVKGMRVEQVHTVLCVCGEGRVAQFPWVPQLESLGFCNCDASWDAEDGVQRMRGRIVHESIPNFGW